MLFRSPLAFCKPADRMSQAHTVVAVLLDFGMRNCTTLLFPYPGYVQDHHVVGQRSTLEISKASYLQAPIVFVLRVHFLHGCTREMSQIILQAPTPQENFTWVCITYKCMNAAHHAPVPHVTLCTNSKTIRGESFMWRIICRSELRCLTHCQEPC